MRRWLILFFLTVLPLQFSWAAVASYCQHEKSPSNAAHFGHHAHDHQVAGLVLGAHEEAQGHDVDPASWVVDDDCAYCHLGCAQPLPSAPWSMVVVGRSPRVPFALLPLDSFIPQAPERPDRRLA